MLYSIDLVSMFPSLAVTSRIISFFERGLSFVKTLPPLQALWLAEEQMVSLLLALWSLLMSSLYVSGCAFDRRTGNCQNCHHKRLYVKIWPRIPHCQEPEFLLSHHTPHVSGISCVFVLHFTENMAYICLSICLCLSVSIYVYLSIYLTQLTKPNVFVITRIKKIITMHWNPFIMYYVYYFYIHRLSKVLLNESGVSCVI